MKEGMFPSLYLEMKELLFGDGPWMLEPDFLKWEYKGIACLIMRTRFGNLCGYAQVPNNHPWHGKQYMELDVEVHGGLTFSGTREEGAQGDFIGFDCANSGDLSPYIHSRNYTKIFSTTFPRDEIYRDFAYTKKECEKLADQILAAEKCETKKD